ncbi:MAG: YgiQ family radical SAM protein [Synergistaceae bacterium]|nr:YgiQ family radical SAM protein [Synergistaceae bacterium]
MEKTKTDKNRARDKFLPVNRQDMERRGWEDLDFLLISGDAYVDHPSFGTAIISRWLESLSFRVGIIAQPDWRSTEDFKRMGKPRIGVMVTAGNLDSMLSHYTASGKKRKTDPYSPGGRAGLRPDRATIVYCNRVRELWKDVPLVIGGIEASLRRMSHYDYWGNDVRRSILADSRADLLVFGMGELAVKDIANALAQGKEVSRIRDVPGTCWKTHDPGNAADAVILPSFEEVRSDKKAFAKAFKQFYIQQNHSNGSRIIQDQGAWNVVQNRPARPLTEKEMDKVYSLPYTRAAHPDYEEAGGIPALEEVRFSITSHRGCFGECSFCAISMHQGRVIQARSDRSMIDEAWSLKKMKDFKGYIHDVGGPTANFMIPSCPDQETKGTCAGKSCLFPAACKKLEADHSKYIGLLRKLREIPGIKKVFIRSGLRYDYILADKKTDFLDELCRYHISGQLKIAPEHVSPAVLKLMRKVPRNVTVKFIDDYRQKNRELGMKQFLVPYFMSSHPGSTIREAVDLAEFIRDSGLRPEQVQDFTPTPGSMSTCMYYTGIDPLTGEEVYVPRDHEERKMQRSLLQYWVPENAETVRKALIKAGREDLIGNNKKCLVPERSIRRRIVK